MFASNFIKLFEVNCPVIDKKIWNVELYKKYFYLYITSQKKIIVTTFFYFNVSR